MNYYFYENIDNKKGKVILEYSIEPPKEMLQLPYVKGIIENPKYIDGKIPILYINLENNKLYYEYEDIPKAQKELQQEKLEDVQRQLLETQTELLLFKQENERLGEQLFNLQTELVEKGVM